MAERKQRPEDESVSRAASLIAQALTELQRLSGAEMAIEQSRRELAASREALESLAARFERQFADEADQRLLLAGQLTSLATSLDRLVNHLQGLSELLAGVIGQSAQAVAQTSGAIAPPQRTEPYFSPGGEGVSLTVASVPSFQAVMDIQKALVAMERVSSASVERFQDGDSRILVHLEAPISAAELAASLRVATSFAFAVEEARPELMSLRLKIVPSA